MENKYEDILRPLRLRKSTIPSRTSIEEFYSDRSRILFSSSFRRLQQKAQVFSLEPNSNVRTRLTHSLEVSDLGRTLANKICNKLEEVGIIKDKSIPPQIVAIVENACLLHDIGNPPFGHFGEAAIKNWIKNNLKSYANKAGIGSKSVDKFISDFLEFDGNPQGIRTIMHLHCEIDIYGLNLTYPTILSGIKYPRVTSTNSKTIWKKAGYFLTEQDCIEKIHEEMRREKKTKYPLAYIMEAADDIAYCLSDISDGIEKRIITLQEFLDDFQSCWKSQYGNISIPVEIPSDCKYYNKLSVSWSNTILNYTVQYYIENHESIWQGNVKDLISDGEFGKVLETIKTVSRKRLYRSLEAESIELSGYSVISGLLKHYGKLLLLSREEFSFFLDESNSPQGKGLDLEWRIFNRISKRALHCYKLQLDSISESQIAKNHNLSEDDLEWWLRVHLIIDQISGMTDPYALEIYHMFEGII